MSLGRLRVHFGSKIAIKFSLFYSEVSNEGKSMKINYFEDTDTAFIEFTSGRVAETRELCENIYIDLDEHKTSSP